MAQLNSTNIFGSLSVTGNSFLTGDINVSGNIDMIDNKKVLLGDGDDLQLYHNGTDNLINLLTGNLIVADTGTTKITFTRTTGDITAGKYNGATIATNTITLGSTKVITAQYASLTVGDATGTGTVTIKSNGATARAVTLAGDISTGGTITTANSLTTAGNFALTLTTTASTNVTLPTTGTLATLAGSETLSSKTLTSPIIGGGSVTFTNAANNTITTSATAAGTVGRHFNIYAGPTTVGGTNIAGGDLLLYSGNSTGTGYSNIYFYTPAGGVSGTALNVATASAVIGKAGVGLIDTDNSHYLFLKPGSNLAANRTLTIVTGDVDRSITFGGNINVGANLTTASSFTTAGAFALTLTTTNTTNATIPAGTITLVDLATAQALSNKTITTTLTPTANDGAALGTTALSWADLFLASGSVINFANGDVTLTHASNKLTLNGGSFEHTQAAADGFTLKAAVAPTTDIFNITNSGFVNVTDSVNGAQIDYFAALTGTAQSSALRVNITNTSTIVGTTTSALRLYVTGSGTASVVTNGLKLDMAAADTGTSNAIFVGTNWDNILNYNGTTVISGTGGLNAAQLYGTISTATAQAITSVGTGTSSLSVAGTGGLSLAQGSATTGPGLFLRTSATPAPVSTTNAFYDGYFYATRVYNAVWNDIADFLKVEDTCVVEPGYAYYYTGKEHKKTDKYATKGTLGIASDTYGFGVGKKGDCNQIPLAIGGFVLAYMDSVYKTGTPLVASKDGKLKKANIFVKLFCPDRVIGSFYKEEKEEEWNGIVVNGRHWVKVK